MPQKGTSRTPRDRLTSTQSSLKDLLISRRWFLVYKIPNRICLPGPGAGTARGRRNVERMRPASRPAPSAGATARAGRHGENLVSTFVDTPGPATLQLSPLNTNVSFRDQAYAALKQAIMQADIYSHAHEIRLDERQLSESLGVSRTPIREAMTVLEQEGFLRTVPRRGVFIVRKTKKQIVEMIEMWAALESMAARLITATARKKDITALRDYFKEFGKDRLPEDHVEEYSRANIAFHQALISLSESPVLVDLTNDLLLHVRGYRQLTIGRKDRTATSLPEHLGMIEALEARDTELAEKRARDHTLGLAAYVEAHGQELFT